MTGNRSITTRENELFARWKETHKGGFITDGVFDEATYLASPVRILFVLKEAVDSADSSFDLRDVVRDGRIEKTWSNIARWTNVVEKSQDAHVQWDDIKGTSRNIRKTALNKVVAINLKKRPGASSSDMNKIAELAHKDIGLQLELYEPDVIVCCGSRVAEILADRIFKVPKKDIPWQSTDRNVWYFDGQQADTFKKFTPIISFHHPQNRLSASLMAFSLLDAWSFIRDKHGLPVRP